MTTLYLIAHRVRGEPAFDVAHKITVTVGANIGDDGTEEEWWIIPTSGHRAYPYWFVPLDHAVDWEMQRIQGNPFPDLPADWPDHYATSSAPSKPRVNLLESLGLAKPSIVGTLTRRI